MKVLVLGTGLVGGPMAIDLAKDNSFEVTAADINKENLNKLPSAENLNKTILDFSDFEKLACAIKEHDIVLSAVPGFLGFNILKEIIKQGKNAVDIAFFPENPFLLDEMAKEFNVTAVVDCGVAPGMSNLLTGYVYSILEATKSVTIYVGGLPFIREYPFEYKAGFSPSDVIEEYVRPARFIEDGKLIVKPALSDPELIYFEKAGTLEAFNSDGLRTLISTLDIPNMKEKTLRYPGHIDKIKLLRESGFFSKEEIDIKGIKIKPVDLTSRLLFPLWKLKNGEPEFTVMKIIIEGIKEGKKLRYVYELFDRNDLTTGVHSMARTTGYTATSVLKLISEGLFTRKGICPTEFIGMEPGCADFVLNRLSGRGVKYKLSIEAY